MSIYDMAELEAKDSKPAVGKIAEQAIFASDYLACEGESVCRIEAVESYYRCFNPVVDIGEFALLVRIADIEKRKLSNEKTTN